MPYRWSVLNRKTLPTISEALKAVQAADAEKNADPRPLMYLLSQLIVADTKLLGLQISVTDDIAGYDWDIKPLKVLENDNEAIRLAGEAKERMLQSGLADHFDHIVAAEFLGTTAIEAVWEREVAGKLIADLSILPATSVWYHQKQYHRIADTPRLQADPIAADRDRYIITRFNPFKTVNPEFVGGTYRTAMWLVMLKHFDWQDWSRFIEIFADPTVLAKHTRTAGDQEKKAAWDMITNMGKNKRLLVSEDIMVEFVTAVKDGSPAAYERLIEKVDNALTILMMGATMSTDVEDKGSRAVADVHMRKEANRMWRRLKMVERSINSQYRLTDWRINESESNPCPYEFAFVTEEREDYASNASIVTELEASGYELDPVEVSKKTGFTVTKKKPTPVSPSVIPQEELNAD